MPADQGGWNVVSSVPDAPPPAAPTQMSGGWNVVSSVPDAPVQPVEQPVAAPPALLPPGTLMHPDAAIQMVTQNADALAGHITGTSTISADAPTFFQRLAAPFVGPGSAYYNANHRNASTPYNPDAPLIDAGANGPGSGGPIAKNITSASQEFLSGLTTPKSIALLLATGGLGAGKLEKIGAPALGKLADAGVKYMPRIRALVSGGFSLDMINNGLKQSPQAVRQIKSGDMAGAAHTLTAMAFTFGMAGAAGHHALTEAAPDLAAAGHAVVDKLENAPSVHGFNMSGDNDTGIVTSEAGPGRASVTKAKPPVKVASARYTSTGQPIRSAAVETKPPVQAPAQPVAAPPAVPPGWNVVSSEPAAETKTAAAPVVEKAEPVKPAAEPPAETALAAKLPSELRGARPRYSYGPKQFSLRFESDLDRAAYITAQKTPSKADAAYLKFAMDATGETEEAIRQHGREVRATIKEQAKDIPAVDSEGKPVTLTVADLAGKRFGAAKPAAAEPAQAVSQRSVAPETGPHGPILRQFRHDAQGALAHLLREGTGDAVAALHHPEVGDFDLTADVAAKLRDKHPEVTGDLQGFISGLKKTSENDYSIQLRNDRGNQRAGVRLDFDGVAKRWLATAFDADYADRKAPPGETAHAPGTGDSGEGTITPSGTESSSSVADKPPSGPTYLGSGFGALEPLFHEAKAEGDRLRLARNEALKAAQAALASPAELHAGEKIRAYLTSERDLWAARTNQALDVLSRKVLPKMQDREALGIAREFRHHPLELRSFIDGSHPFLSEVDGGTAVAEKNLAPLIPAMKQAARILASPTPRERAADAALTTIADRDLEEGRKGGWMESRWLSDEYLPHALNPKGEGKVAKLPGTAGRQMGNIGKWFGFGERRNDRYPTLVHAVADGIIPKTLDPAALFTIHADQFARARATHLLEAQLVNTGLGQWGERASVAKGWVQLADHTDEFKKRFVVTVPNSYDAEAGESEHAVGKIGLYVPEFIAKALGAITAPDPLAGYPFFAKFRNMQRGLKEAILGLSGFHLLTENFMAAADVGPAGMLRAFRATRDSAGFLADERDLIASGGTTSIQGSTITAYRSLRPGTIPTRAEIVRAYIPGSKQVLQIADGITRFTFNNVQRRFKVTAFSLHRDAWLHDNRYATPEQTAEAKKGIASYVNGVYGGLHWENMGWSRAMVEAARAVALAPDWSGSNLALGKYATFDSQVSPRELAFRKRLAGATSKESAQARLSRAFWTKQLVGGLAATQMLSLLLSGKLSSRPLQVYLGNDPQGKEVYQNVFFRGSAGDAANLEAKTDLHVREGYEKEGPPGILSGILVGAGVFVAGKAAPVTKLGIHLLTAHDDFGRAVTLDELASDVLPIPIVGKSIAKTMTGDDSDKYLWSERILGLFGPGAQHFQATKRGLLKEYTDSLRLHAAEPADVAEARQAGRFSAEELHEAEKNASLSPTLVAFEHANMREALKLYGKAPAAEKKQLQGMLLKKLRTALEREAPADRAKTLADVKAALAAR